MAEWKAGRTVNLSAQQQKRAQRLVGGGRTERVTSLEAKTAKNVVDIGQTKWVKASERGGKGRGGLLTDASGKAVTGTVKLPGGGTATYVRGKRIGMPGRTVVSAPKPSAGGGGGGGSTGGGGGGGSSNQMSAARIAARKARTMSVKAGEERAATVSGRTGTRAPGKPSADVQERQAKRASFRTGTKGSAKVGQRSSLSLRGISNLTRAEAMKQWSAWSKGMVVLTSAQQRALRRIIEGY